MNLASQPGEYWVRGWQAVRACSMQSVTKDRSWQQIVSNKSTDFITVQKEKESRYISTSVYSDLGSNLWSNVLKNP